MLSPAVSKSLMRELVKSKRQKQRLLIAAVINGSQGLFICFDEPTWRCHQNPFIGALGIQEPVMPGEPLIEG